jgi:hypothetical protein
MEDKVGISPQDNEIVGLLLYFAAHLEHLTMQKRKRTDHYTY